MTKLIINERQYNLIILHEKIKKLFEDSNDVLLGVALILGVKLSGQNKRIALNALNNKKIMNDIQSTLEDENKTQELIKSLTDKGMKNPEKLLIDKIDDLVHKYELGHSVYNNLTKLL